jgi:hypothetical protein
VSRSQEAGAAAEEISARQAAVGGSWAHYGDDLVPRQSCFGQDTRALMNGFAVPVMNQFGLCPAPVKGTKNPIAPLTITKDLDKLGVLKGVTTFNFHLHLPPCADDQGLEVHSCAGQAADRPVPSASVPRRRETASSIRASACRRRAHAAAIPCWPTRQSSPRCVVAPLA